MGKRILCARALAVGTQFQIPCVVQQRGRDAEFEHARGDARLDAGTLATGEHLDQARGHIQRVCEIVIRRVDFLVVQIPAVEHRIDVLKETLQQLRMRAGKTFGVDPRRGLGDLGGAATFKRR